MARESTESKRPDLPLSGDLVWYRGWELGFYSDRAYWAGDGFVAYRGGCDLDAPELSSATWNGLLDEIDDEEGDTK